MMKQPGGISHKNLIDIAVQPSPKHAKYPQEVSFTCPTNYDDITPDIKKIHFNSPRDSQPFLSPKERKKISISNFDADFCFKKTPNSFAKPKKVNIQLGQRQHRQK